ncbi:MAG: ferritin-like domain-containing protein [Sphingomonadaceae bacterium]|nr:ferritin-like domain-containing protein [Sphingomonadaceae bacterium]
MFARFRRRYLDVLASVYIYNEHRGYTSIDRVLEAVVVRHPEAADFIAEVKKHRADERKHYKMFRRYFELKGEMPLAVDRTCGHIDHFIRLIFGCTIDDLDTGAVTGDETMFRTLCRVIALTEMRGLRQVDVLLRSAAVRSDPVLHRIFTIIERDEPDHFLPYVHWLEATGGAGWRKRERLADWWIHKSLMLAKLPAVFLNPRMPRLADWPDAADATA